MKKIILLLLTIIPVISFAQDKRNYFIHLSSDPMINPSAAIMSVHAANEALKQGHKVIYFVAGDGVRILINDVINNLNGYTYDWDEKSGKTGEGVGVIAQEVTELIPSAVRENQDGYLSVDYIQLIPHLIEEVKSLNNRIKTLENK